jgi:hypothetical protein
VLSGMWSLMRASHSEAGLPPAELLLDELGGDGVAFEESGEDSPAEKAHQERGV